jgi:tetratricopeptide (TPR) repeat protein
VRRILAEALRHDPAAYYVRYEATESLQRRWGGSEAEMEAIALAAAPYTDRNPRLFQLFGTVHAERALAALRAGDVARERAEWTAALSYGRLRIWLQNRARLSVRVKDHRAAIVDLDELLSYEPDHAWGLTFRSQARYGLGEYPAALGDVVRAVELSPREAWIASQHGRVLAKLERFEEAVAAYTRAFGLDAGRHADEGYKAAFLLFSELRRSKDARPLMERLVGMEADDPRVWALYGEVLADLGDPGARPAFERYLALADESDLQERERVRRVRAWLASPAAPPANAAP